MRHRFIGILAALVLSGGPATAGVDIGFGANVPIGDDANLFVSISSRYFDCDQRVVEEWGHRYYPDPDDLAVALFLNRHCDQGPDYFFKLRQQGLGWFEISNRCRVPVDVYFLPVRHDPGPPYGHAYGSWKKHQRDHHVPIVLSDADIRNLVAARMVHEYYGVPADEALRWRASGHDVRTVMTGEYRKRHPGKAHHDKGGHGRHRGNHE